MRKILNLAHYFPYDVKRRLLAHSRSFLANQKARNAIVGAENLLNLDIPLCDIAMLLVRSCVPVITWLCNRAMRFQSRPTIFPLLTIESPVAQWLEHPTRSWRVVGLNPIWDSDFFRVLLTLISCCCFIYNM